MRTLFLVVGSSILMACSASGPNHGEHAPAAPDKPVASAEVRTLTIEPDALRVDGNHVVFTPDSRVQRAEYDVYRFEKDAFLEKVGTLAPKEPIVVTVEVTAVDEKRYTPSDPSLPAPMGGFVTRTYTCRILRIGR